MRLLFMLVGPTVLSATLAAQTQQPVPQPFPRPGEQPAQEIPDQRQNLPAEPPPAQPPASNSTGGPTESVLGVQVYPTASFLTSYEAGYGQRYYLFGTNVPFNEIVNYYVVILETRGDRVFDTPPTHIFEFERFREESMAFPPSVTIKDYTWNGSQGYLNPQLDAIPNRFQTVIQIVPPTANNLER